MKLGVGVNSCFSEKYNQKIVAKSRIGILLLLINITASADQFDTLNYSASAGISYDNNIFRLPSSVDPLQAIGQPTKSDVIKTESIGINLDKKYANQEVIFKGNVTNNKFNTFSNLDYTNTVYNAAWSGNLTSRLSVGVSDSHTQTLNSFTDIHVYTRNLTTVDTPHLNADWWFASNWHLTFGLTESTTKTSQSVINNQSYTSQAREWGVKYTPADGSSISLISRLIQNENINAVLYYPLLVDTGNTESQQELDFNWILTGKSTLSGNLLSINHQYPTFSQRDFSGLEGGINYLWSISDKTYLNVSLNRAISSWIDIASSYYVTDTASIAPSWQISTKTDMQISLSHSRANFFGPIIPFTIARYDQIQSEGLGFDWSPQRSVKLSSSIQYAHRYSNYSSFEYDDKSASLSVQVSF